MYRGLNANRTDRIGPTDGPATVYYYLLSSSAVWGVDFAGANGSVGFSAGVTVSHLRIDILSTTFTEKNFTIQLLSPSGDVVLGVPATATVLVSTSPGTIGWMPSNITSVVDNGTSQSLRLLRKVGVYGVVTVRWSLLLASLAGEVVGVSPTSGVEVFKDGVDKVDVLLSPLSTGRPRPVQVCVAVLTSASGGAVLPDSTDTFLLREKRIVIADSGSAYGIVDLLPANCSMIVVRRHIHTHTYVLFGILHLSCGTNFLIPFGSLISLVHLSAPLCPLNLPSTCLMVCSILGSRPISFPSLFLLSSPLPRTDYLVNESAK